MDRFFRLAIVVVPPWIGCILLWASFLVGALSLQLSGSDDYSGLVSVAILSGCVLFPLVALLLRRRALRSGAGGRQVAAALLLFALTPLPIVFLMGFA
jgi:hypothetical protein